MLFQASLFTKTAVLLKPHIPVFLLPPSNDASNVGLLGTFYFEYIHAYGADGITTTIRQ